MTSIIINTFYRALQKIEEETEEGFQKYTAKTLARRLVDDLYPEDGYITLEDDPRGSLRVHLDEKFLDRVREQIAKGLGLKDATEAVGFKKEEPAPQEATVPMSEPAPEVKEVKVKEVKPKLTKEQKEAEKAKKDAEKEAKAAEKAKKEAEKQAKIKKEASVDELTDKLAAMTVAPKKAPAKPKFVGNIEKLNPTQEKTWKKVAAEAKVELTDDHKKRFLAGLNALDNTVYNTKKLEAHMIEFFTPKQEVQTKDEEMWAIEYKGKEYGVNDKGEVFEDTVLENGETVGKKVGMVGMAYFAEMEQPSA
jgi:hypothetical protein